MKSFRQLMITAVTVLAAGVGATTAQAAVAEAEALTTAIHHAGVVGLKSGAVQVSSSGPIPFVRSRFVFNGGEGGLGGNSQATSFPFVLSGDGTFEPNIPSPPGRRLPQSKYLGVIVDSTSNDIEDEYFGPTPPAIEQLGTVVTISLTSSDAATAATSCHVDQLLTAALARKHLGARRYRAALALRRCEARHR
jgi:hypothetical protein